MPRKMSFADFWNDPAQGWTRVTVTQGIALAFNLIATLITVATNDARWLLLWSASIILFVWVIYRMQRRPEPLVLVPDNQQPRQYPGLIVIIGKGRPDADPMEQSAKDAIEYHAANSSSAGLKFCWLVATTGAQGSFPYAQKFQAFCEERGVKAQIEEVHDPFGVQNTYEVVRDIYETKAPQVGLTEHDLIADVTGGTSPMSVGMALACGDRRAMEYMYGQPYRGKKDIASVPRLLKFAPRSRRRS